LPRAHPRTAPVFSLASPKGGEGRGEEAQGFTAQIPSPRSGGERETGQCQDAPICRGATGRGHQCTGLRVWNARFIRQVCNRRVLREQSA
jgi:hypothetical protein